MPLLSVYNHLMQGFAMSKQTRFDTHKKSELRDVYNNIMRLTQEQPFYKVDFNESAQKYTLGIKDYALSLSTSLKELYVDDDSSVFKRKALSSSNPKAVELEVNEYEDPTHSITKPVEIEVKSLATRQENVGSPVVADASDLPSGKYNFTANVDNGAYSFQFNVTDNSTNLTLLTKLSDFINKTPIGISTNVIHSRESGLARLELKSVYAGTKTPGTPAFSFEDTALPSDANVGITEHFGLNNIKTPAANTVFTVNGREHETRTGNYFFSKGINLKLNRVTDEPVIISTVTDKTPVVKKINDLIGKYNDTIDFIKETGNDTRSSRRLIRELSNVTLKYKDNLAEHGIDVEGGKLVANNKILYPAAESGKLEDFFTEEDGFVKALERKLNNISINPMDYLDKTVITYPNTQAAHKAFSPYITSVYSGLLYNNYC